MDLFHKKEIKIEVIDEKKRDIEIKNLNDKYDHLNSLIIEIDKKLMNLYYRMNAFDKKHKNEIIKPNAVAFN